MVMHNMTTGQSSISGQLWCFGYLHEIECQTACQRSLQTGQAVRHEQEFWQHFAAVKGRLNTRDARPIDAVKNLKHIDRPDRQC